MSNILVANVIQPPIDGRPTCGDWTAARWQWNLDVLSIVNDPDFIQARYPLRLINADTDYNPVTGDSSGGEEQTVYATLLDFNQSQYDGDNIKIGDKMAIIVNSELSISVLNNSTSFRYDLGGFCGGETAGKVISTQTDPMGVTTILQLRS